VMLLLNFVLLLGVIIIAVSLPIADASVTMSTDLLSQCVYDPVTTDLQAHAVVLRNIRDSPDCQAEESVASCKGWKSTPVTEYLLRTGSEHECLDFCPLPPLPPKSKTTALLQKSNSTRRHRAGVPQALLSVGSEAASPSDFHWPYSRVGLFTLEPRRTPCSVAIAATFETYIGTIATQLFVYGCSLVAVSLLVSFGKLTSTCEPERKPIRSGSG